MERLAPGVTDRRRLMERLAPDLTDRRRLMERLTPDVTDRRRLLSCHTYSRFRRLFALPIVSADSPAENQVKDAVEEVTVAPPKVLSDDEVNAYIEAQDGWTRVKHLYTTDDQDQITDDMKLVLFGTGQAAFVTFLLGMWIGSRQAGEYYVYRHQAAKYETRFRAMRAYYDAVLVGSLAHGIRYATKIGAFTGIFMLSSQTIATYRNKTSALEYTVGGALTGAVLRLQLGFRGMAAGGVLGGLLGLAGGMMVWGMMTSSKQRQQDRYFAHVQHMLLERKRLKTIQENSARRAAEKRDKAEAL